MSILIPDSRIIVQGITGREAVSFTRDMLDYGAKVVGGVTPGRGGRDVAGVPVFDTVRQITDRQRVDVSVLAVPAPALRDAAFEAIEAGVPLLVILTERVPRTGRGAGAGAGRDARRARRRAQQHGHPRRPAAARSGPIGGPAEDAGKAYAPGPVGIMSRSGGMTTEIANLLTRHGLGPEHGGEHGRRPHHRQHLRRAACPSGRRTPRPRRWSSSASPAAARRRQLARYLREHGTRLPIVAFIAGGFMEEMPGLRFGHAGSIVEGKADTAAAKARVLREAGVLVAEDLSEIPSLLAQALGHGSNTK